MLRCRSRTGGTCSKTANSMKRMCSRNTRTYKWPQRKWLLDGLRADRERTGRRLRSFYFVRPVAAHSNPDSCNEFRSAVRTMRWSSDMWGSSRTALVILTAISRPSHTPVRHAVISSSINSSLIVTLIPTLEVVVPLTLRRGRIRTVGTASNRTVAANAAAEA